MERLQQLEKVLAAAQRVLDMREYEMLTHVEWDALESAVNVLAAFAALVALHVAAQPADEGHPYGHGKAEYFSSWLEGALIVIAAIAIGVTAVDRLLHPRPLQDVGVGLAVSAAAALVNLAVGALLVRSGRRERSITLEADGKHLLTDVWTSA